MSKFCSILFIGFCVISLLIFKYMDWKELRETDPDNEYLIYYNWK